jgi:hypothetical protein
MRYVHAMLKLLEMVYVNIASNYFKLLQITSNGISNTSSGIYVIANFHGSIWCSDVLQICHM